MISVVVLRIVPPLYALTGYFSAFCIAKRTVQDGTATLLGGGVARWGAMSMLGIMPIAAISGCYRIWNNSVPIGEFFGILVGMSMNVCFFFGGCLALLQKKTVPQRMTEDLP